MMIRMIAGLLLVSIMCGCASTSQDTLRREQFEQLPNKYSQFDFKLAWSTRITDTGVTVDGLIWNLRWQHAESLEVWVALLDPEGQVLAKEAGLVIPNPLNINEVSNFSVKLPLKPLTGSKLRFTYSYYGVDDQESSTFWMQSFETVP
jgi:hypothetical protein